MTMQTIGSDPWPIRIAEQGWHRLKEGAQAAMTYFKPGDEHDVAVESQRWGALAADVVDHSKTLEVRMEVPGVDPADLNVEIHGRRLMVSGERRCDSKRQEGTVMVTERAFGRFQRVIPIPDDIIADKVKAKYRDGVLVLKLPKRNTKGPGRVTIQID